MSDNDYAACIYCKVFFAEKDDGDMYVQGVLDAISTLTEREQLALEYYYRYDMTYTQVGEKLGVSNSRAGGIIKKAIGKLHSTSRAKKMSVSKIIEDYKKMLEDKNEIIEDKDDIILELSNQIEDLLRGKQISKKCQDILEQLKPNIEEMDFPTQIYNILKKAGFNKVDEILALDTPDDLLKLGGFGVGLLAELIAKMRERGYTEWADKMEAPRTKLEIEKIGLSPYTRNLLIKAGIHKLDDLLALDTIEDLMKLHGFGKAVRSEIIVKMRENGYSEWTNKIKIEEK